MPRTAAANFQERHAIRIRVWMRDHAEDFDSPRLLAEEVTWLYNAYVGEDGIPDWVIEEADKIMKEKPRV